MMIFQNIDINKIRRMAFEQLFSSLSYISSYQPAVRKAESSCMIYENIVYGPAESPYNLLDVYRPKVKHELMPVLIYIHGGGFTMCSKDTHRPVALAYAGRDYLVFNINYRLAPKYRYPCAVEDICLAYEWIVKNAHQYGGNIKKIAVAGDSAGANLALALIAACCYPMTIPEVQSAWQTDVIPKAAQLMCGLYQVSNPDRFEKKLHAPNAFIGNFHLDIAKSVSKAYLGNRYQEHSQDLALADPLVILESDLIPERPLPAIYAMTAENDIIFSDTERLEQALIEKNVVHDVQYYPKEGHVFHLLFWKEIAREAWRDGFRFLSQYCS
ncbi:MAG: hypothetical protein OMM_04163 [Candidatus Magnetoglobus multicellularis str. Araruama]|uniref:Alpha/beta hydrolase fold-3 domain-containing protein n=1 Tax=Candidatus Magnetoglobus multicellularis str. Araruama TaxID=890399 RepID=A0A1V1P2Q7_9BACT|nr:MAG: hypothetical protein OMM_04163 [Candidatus Magnetoglobus multicellularis str. Araruama]